MNYVAYGVRYRSIRAALTGSPAAVPISGRATVRTAGREVEVGPARVASLLSPTLPTEIVWQDNCAQLILLADSVRLKQAAALAEKAVGPVEFEPHVDLDTPFGRALQCQIEYLVDLQSVADMARICRPLWPQRCASRSLGCF